MAKPTLLTNGVRITCGNFYQPDYSNPLQNEFMHAYKVTIENNNLFPIRLIARKWIISDSDGEIREVEGEGVVGMQPIIDSGEEFEYVSGTNLHTEMGTQSGSYLMENLHTKEMFFVEIPMMTHFYPAKLN